jgi:hypothetical protein
VIRNTGIRSSRSLGLASLSTLLVASSACSWTTFDDLEGDTWVTSTEKPDNDSSNWGVAIQRGQASGTGGRLVVMGANQSLYSELQVTSDGDITVPATQLQLNSQFGIGNLDPQPILLADPASNDVALVTSSGSASIAVLKGSNGNLVVHQVFGPASADAATYMVPPAPASEISQTLVAEGDKVYGTFFVNPQNPQPSCPLKDGTSAVMVGALGALPTGGATNDVIVWSTTGKVLVYPGSVFNGCVMQTATTVSAAETSGKPGKGSQILPFTNGTNKFAVLQGHDMSGNGFLALFNFDGVPTLVGSARTENGIKTAALMELAGKRYVVAGFPDAIVDGNAGAGQVQVFEVDTTTGIGNSVMTLHDAQPEGKQAFGRSVTVMPFDGKPLIVVAADNEVFTYFRTTLYDETRLGR